MRRFVVLALLALLSAVPAVAQEDSPGIAHTTGTIPTGDIHMGTNRIDGSNIVFTGGSLTGLSSLGATGSSALTGGGTLSGTFAGSPTLSGALSLTGAGTALSVTNNGTFGGTLATGTSSTNGLLLSGTTLSATGTGNGSPTIKALGTGSINLQTGATPFTGLQLVDPGASAVNFIRVQAHATGLGVDLSAVGDAAAVLNIKAGSNNGGSVHFFVPAAIGLLSQHTNVTLTGSNPAEMTSLGYVQIASISGNNGANSNTNGFNQFILTDTAQVNGSMGLMTFSQNYTTGADGPRNMMDEVFSKSAPSVSGNGTYELHRFFLHIDSDEGGTGTAMTASIAAGTLTVTAATTPVLQVGTIVSGAGMKPTKIVGLLSGTGGTGTYSVDIPQEVSSQAMVGGNYKGDAEVMNPDIRCNGGSWWHGCLLAEWDIRAQSGDVLFKSGLDLHYALNDSGHGVWVDCALCISAGDYAPGVGKGHVLISLGTPVSTWPVNIADTNSALIRAQPNTTRTSGANPSQYISTFGVDFTVLECGTACWRSPGFAVDGSGQLNAGPLTVTYGASGAVISAPRLTTASASVVLGGGGFVLHDEVLEPLTGSLWDIASLGAGNGAASLTLSRAGFANSCPASGTRFTSLGVGGGLTGTITCSTSNGITLGSSSDKLAFYGVTPIVKATPSGACAGSTGCQAIRNALANLGLINSGSISD